MSTITTLTIPDGFQQDGGIVFGRSSGLPGDNIDHAFLLNGTYRLSFLRVHFVGGSGTSAITVSQYDTSPSATALWDISLWSASGVSAVGTGADFHLRISDAAASTIPWAFDGGAGMSLLVAWTNPHASTKWGLEIGLGVV